ncbi:MAG: hypothetical protein AAFW69_08325, partial [Pseudomonadota bacterium]
MGCVRDPDGVISVELDLPEGALLPGTAPPATPESLGAEVLHASRAPLLNDPEEFTLAIRLAPGAEGEVATL